MGFSANQWCWGRQTIRDLNGLNIFRLIIVSFLFELLKMFRGILTKKNTIKLFFWWTRKHEICEDKDLLSLFHLLTNKLSFSLLGSYWNKIFILVCINLQHIGIFNSQNHYFFFLHLDVGFLVRLLAIIMFTF